MLFNDWEVVSCRINKAASNLFWIALQTLLTAEPMNRSSVTFTVRQRSTGALRSVTAVSKREAGELIAKGQFDRHQYGGAR
jgi:hypothetical protein